MSIQLLGACRAKESGASAGGQHRGMERSQVDRCGEKTVTTLRFGVLCERPRGR